MVYQGKLVNLLVIILYSILSGVPCSVVASMTEVEGRHDALSCKRNVKVARQLQCNRPNVHGLGNDRTAMAAR
jgi:hypothetical protein